MKLGSEGFKVRFCPDSEPSLLACFWPNRFEVWAFWRGSKGFEVQFWWMNLGSSEFEVQPVKFEAV